MTLIITELNSYGIVMAADSAVTHTSVTGEKRVVANGAKKLHPVWHLHAGLSAWGMGSINGQETDNWMVNFIDTNRHLKSLRDFAEELAKQLNEQIPPEFVGQGKLGFHLAGFELYNEKPTPSFYHIHDGRSTTLEMRGIAINPNKFNANHDITPEVFNQVNSTGGGWITRNGDYQLYAQIFGLLESFFAGLKQRGVVIPNSQDLNERAKYLVFQIRTMASIYDLSNLVPGIGGSIHYLTINHKGIDKEDRM